MLRSFPIAGLCAILLAGAVFAQRPEESERAARAGERAQKRAIAKERAKATDTPLEQWQRMTPQERQRALAKLTPERRRELQQKLQQFRNLPPEQRQQLRERYRAFSQLPPEQQNHARELFRQFNSLPEDRRPIVKREFEELRSMPESERRTRMNSEAFRNRYSPGEQQMLHDLARVFGSPP